MRRRRGWLVGVPLAVLVAAGVGIAATGGGPARPKACLPYAVSQRQIAAVGRTAARPRPLPDFSHVVVILMENRECGQVVGSPQARFENSLGRRYAMLPRPLRDDAPLVPQLPRAHLRLDDGSAARPARSAATAHATWSTCSKRRT